MTGPLQAAITIDLASTEQPSLDIDGHRNGLTAELSRGLAHQIGMQQSGAVNHDLFDPGAEDLANVLDGVDSAAIGNGHEAFARDVLDGGESRPFPRT